MKTEKLLARVGTVILMLCGVVISLKHLREPDVWWQLKTGQWMLENFAVTRADMFSYTFAGTEWINVKWLTEIIMHMFSMIGGPEFTPVLQAIITPLVLWLFLKNSGLLLERFKLSPDLQPHFLVLLVGLISLVAMEFRLNGRPEMVSLLMTGIFLFVLLRYRFEPSKQIFWLIPLQMLWANLHEAYGTGIVMIVAFTIAAWVDHMLLKKTKAPLEAPKLLTYAGLGAIAAISINPNGPKMIVHPFNILGQVFENKYTTELISFQNPKYWKLEAFIALIMLVLVAGLIVTIIVSGKKIKKPWLRAVNKLGLGYIGLIVAFFYLGLTAYRNIPFFIIIAAPAFALGLVYFLETRLQKIKIPSTIAYGVVGVLGLLFYIGICTNAYYKVFNDRNRFGLAVDPLKNPVGVAEFIKANDIKGKGFADYLTSAYLLWDQYPDFKSFIDLRDLDIFPGDFFADYLKMVSSPKAFRDKNEAEYNFDYVVLYRPSHSEIHKYLVNFSDYKLVYADAVAALYLKDKEDYESVIRQYRHVMNEDDIFQYVPTVETSTPAKIITRIFWPFYKSPEPGISHQDIAAAQFHSAIADPNVAAARAAQVIDAGEHLSTAHDVLGNVYYVAAVNQKDAELRDQIMQTAMENYRLAIENDPKQASAYNGLANCHMQYRNFVAAEEQYKLAIKHDKHLLSAYIGLGELYKALEQANPANANENIKKRIEAYTVAANLEPGNDVFYFQVGQGYCSLNDCDGVNQFLSQITNPELLPENDQYVLKQCLNRCK